MVFIGLRSKPQKFPKFGPGVRTWRSNVSRAFERQGRSNVAFERQAKNTKTYPLDVRTCTRGVRTSDFFHSPIFLILEPFGAKLANARQTQTFVTCRDLSNGARIRLIGPPQQNMTPYCDILLNGTSSFHMPQASDHCLSSNSILLTLKT